jgi:hypothetical protein
MAGANGKGFIRQVVRAKRHPKSADLGLISLTQLSMAPVRLFLVDPAPVLNAVNAKLGSV